MYVDGWKDGSMDGWMTCASPGLACWLAARAIGRMDDFVSMFLHSDYVLYSSTINSLEVIKFESFIYIKQMK